MSPEASITCPRCGRESFNPTDVAERYCGACHQFHRDLERFELQRFVSTELKKIVCGSEPPPRPPTHEPET